MRLVVFMYFSSRDTEMPAMNNSHIYRTLVRVARIP